MCVLVYTGMEFIFIIAILLMSVVIHEVAHGYGALALGDPTAKLQGRLTLNPLKHIDIFGSIIVPTLFYLLGGFLIGWAKPVEYNPYNFKRLHKWGDAIVAVVGPLTNIVIALIFGFLIRFEGMWFNLSSSFIEIASFVVFINIVLACFNLIPIPPLDGSKILFTILPRRWSFVRTFLERHSLIFVFIFILFLWQFFVPVVMGIFRLITGITLVV